MGVKPSRPCCADAPRWPSCWCACDDTAEEVRVIEEASDEAGGVVLTPRPESNPVCKATAVAKQQHKWQDSEEEIPGMVPVTSTQGDVTGKMVEEEPPEPELSHLDRSLDVLRAKALEPYCNVESLRAALQEGDTVLVKGSWLIGEFRKGRGMLPCRQALPREAVCSPDVVLRWPVLAVSYCWLTPDHPDPKGRQFPLLASLVEQFLESRRNEPNMDVAIFIDWCSLHQEPRSEQEQASFLRSLSHIGLWFAHRETHVWLLSRTPDGVRSYEDRGWPALERAISQMITPREKVLDIGKLDRSCQYWKRTSEVCQMRALPPLSPEFFTKQLALKVFTKISDQAFVEKSYRQVFEDVMGSLPEMNWTGCGWREEEARHLAETLPKCERLEHLDLTGNQLANGGTIKIASVITNCMRLKHLGLAANRIADDGAVEIASSLPGCRRLQKLGLARNLIGDRGAQKLANAIPHCQQLEELDLGGNEIGEVGAENLAVALPLCKRLGLLGLFENQISNNGAERLAAALPQCRKLHELHLGRNEIGDSGASKLAAALPNCVNLQNLELGGNEIGDTGAHEIATAIPRCGSLQKLDLARNQIGDKGADRLAEAIPHCKSLQEFGLGGNEIGEILGGSRITDGGVDKMAAAIQRCGHLRKLDLSENRIGNGGAAKLAAAMPSCSSLKELDLCGNQISDGGAEQLLVAIPQCKRLNSLSLFGNRIGNRSQSRLREAWCSSGKPEQQLGF